MKNLKREVLIFLALFIILALVVHVDAWISHPLEHLAALPSSDFGPLHPLFFSFGAYLALLIVRLFARMVRRILSKGS